MHIVVSETIARPASEVWHTLAHEFDQISDWYAPIVKSYQLPDVEPIPGAAQNGRICEISADGSRRAVERRSSCARRRAVMGSSGLEPRNMRR